MFAEERSNHVRSIRETSVNGSFRLCVVVAIRMGAAGQPVQCTRRVGSGDARSELYADPWSSGRASMRTATAATAGGRRGGRPGSSQRASRRHSNGERDDASVLLLSRVPHSCVLLMCNHGGAAVASPLPVTPPAPSTALAHLGHPIHWLSLLHCDNISHVAPLSRAGESGTTILLAWNEE